MKALRTLAGVLAVAGLLGFSFNAVAQENGNRDENGKIVRGPYETNRFGDNWFIGFGAGANSFVNDHSDFDFGGVAIDAFVGKWFTPSVGARIGYKGLQNNLNLTDNYLNGLYKDYPTTFGEDDFYQHLFHADLMWNISNAFSGYKETRFWDLIPYASAGYVYSTNGKPDDQSWAIGGGLLNDFRLGNRVDLYLDLTGMIVPDSGYNVWKDGDVALLPSVTAGLIINLGRTNFDRHSSVTPVVVPVPFTTEQYNALKDRVAALEKENAALKDEVERLKNKTPDTVYVQSDAIESDSYSFFDLGSATLSDREKMHLDFYADAVKDNLGDKTLTVTGSADKGTGSATTNQKLAERRANAVKDYLVKKGVPASQIETVALGGIDGKKDARRVVVSVK